MILCHVMLCVCGSASHVPWLFVLVLVFVRMHCVFVYLCLYVCELVSCRVTHLGQAEAQEGRKTLRLISLVLSLSLSLSPLWIADFSLQVLLLSQDLVFLSVCVSNSLVLVCYLLTTKNLPN
jgi:hypothetical protein